MLLSAFQQKAEIKQMFAWWQGSKKEGARFKKNIELHVTYWYCQL